MGLLQKQPLFLQALAIALLQCYNIVIRTFDRRIFMIICPSCSSEIEDGAYVCPICGASLNGELYTITILKTQKNIPWSIPTTYSVSGNGVEESISLPNREGAVFTVPAGVYTVRARYATKKAELTITVDSNVNLSLLLKLSGKLVFEMN